MTLALSNLAARGISREALKVDTCPGNAIAGESQTEIQPLQQSAGIDPAFRGV